MHDAIANGTYLCIPFKERGKGQMTEKKPKDGERNKRY